MPPVTESELNRLAGSCRTVQRQGNADLSLGSVPAQSRPGGRPLLARVASRGQQVEAWFQVCDYKSSPPTRSKMQQVPHPRPAAAATPHHMRIQCNGTSCSPHTMQRVPQVLCTWMEKVSDSRYIQPTTKETTTVMMMPRGPLLLADRVSSVRWADAS